MPFILPESTQRINSLFVPSHKRVEPFTRGKTAAGRACRSAAKAARQGYRALHMAGRRRARPPHDKVGEERPPTLHLLLPHHAPTPSLREGSDGDGDMGDVDGGKGVVEDGGHPPPLLVPMGIEATQVAVRPKVGKADDRTSLHRHPDVVGMEGGVPGSQLHSVIRPSIELLGAVVPGVDDMNRLIKQFRRGRAAGAVVGTNVHALPSFP